MKQVCDRCHASLRGGKAYTMSIFNTETICMGCCEKERAHPKFKAAREADDAAIRAGNFNFAGIGKPEDL